MAEAAQARTHASVFIAASPERVFDAWLDPKIAARFMAAGDTRVGELELDPRPGGAFRIVMEGAAGRYEHHGRYVLIDRPCQLVFTWISDGTAQRLSLVTVAFTPEGQGVRVELEHEGLPDPERAERHGEGWSSILGKLSVLFTAA
jgi:uncharacterized protein YndB with AHSA1/START domain